MAEERLPHSIWTNPVHYVACGFGSGACPKMPGTVGTLVGILVYLMIMNLPVWLYILTVFILILAAIVLCDIVNRDFGTDDHPAAVSDEIVGYLVVMIGIPNSWPFIILGFLFFRLFDIWKPGLIGYVDRHVHGGFGVVADDVLAALHAWVFLYLFKLMLS